MAHPPAAQASVDARILAAATELIRRDGFARMTVVAVARAAGMTHANVYRYFPSKIALADAVTAEWLRPIERTLGEVADAPDPADDKLERIILGLAGARRDRLDTDPRLFELFLAAFEDNRVVARKHGAKVRALVDRAVEEGIGSALFASRRRERAVTLVFDICFRFVHPVGLRLDRDLPRRAFDDRLADAVKVLLRALKAGVV